jgi:nitric oxide reductase NorQ protein
MSPKRNQGDLQQQLLEVLAKEDRPMTVNELHAPVDALASTSPGAVLQALRRLEAEQRVVCTGGKPMAFALAGTATAAAAPSAPPPRPPGRVPVGPVQRPNGQQYYPRDLAGEPDVEVLRQLRDANTPVLLEGPPGSGKTALAEAAHTDLITIAGDGDTCVADLVGEYTQEPNGNFVFSHGPLVRAMREGRALLIDDATLIPPPVLAVLYPAMDGRGEITIKAHKGELVKAAPGFYPMAGHNPGVHGAVLTAALASRFSVHIEVTTDFQLARKLDVPEPFVLIAMALDAHRRNGDIAWAPQMRELISARKVTTTLGFNVALDNLLSVAPEDDRDIVAAVIAQVTRLRRTRLRLGAQITTTTASAPAASQSKGTTTP